MQKVRGLLDLINKYKAFFFDMDGVFVIYKKICFSKLISLYFLKFSGMENNLFKVQKRPINH